MALLKTQFGKLEEELGAIFNGSITQSSSYEVFDPQTVLQGQDHKQRFGVVQDGQEIDPNQAPEGEFLVGGLGQNVDQHPENDLNQTEIKSQEIQLTFMGDPTHLPLKIQDLKSFAASKFGKNEIKMSSVLDRVSTSFSNPT